MSDRAGTPGFGNDEAGAPDSPPPATLPTAWRDDWARELAAPRRAIRSEGRRQRWMCFRLGQQHFALPAASVGRSHAPGPTHVLPGRGGAIVDRLTQLEGRLVLTADLAAAMKLPDSAGHDPTRVLELAATPASYALPVDEVVAIVDLDDAAVEPVPFHLGPGLAAVLHGLWRDEHGQTVALIEPARLADRLDADLG